MPQERENLPRLRREFYQGLVAVHWTFCLENRARGWLSEAFAARFREVIVHAGVRHGCVCPAYCLMPDHLHVLLLGLGASSDLFLAARFLRTHLGSGLIPSRFQKQGYDHVLREEERRRDAFAKICHYIWQNPVRAGLVERAEDWKFSGAMVPGFPDLKIHEPGYWELFWRLDRCSAALDPTSP